jgi:hypothetical protein
MLYTNWKNKQLTLKSSRLWHLQFTVTPHFILVNIFSISSPNTSEHCPFLSDLSDEAVTDIASKSCLTLGDLEYFKPGY